MVLQQLFFHITKKKKKKKKKKKEKKFYPFLRTYSNLKMKTVKHFSKKL